MAKTIINYVLRHEYDKWLQDNGVKTKNSRSQYVTGLTQFDKKITIKSNQKVSVKYVDIIGSFVLSHNVAEAFFYLDELENDPIFMSAAKANKNLGSWCNKYRDFILSCVVFYPASASITHCLAPGTLAQLRKKVTKGRIQTLNCKFDAMTPLIATIGVGTFIKLAIEHSIFFDVDKVKIRFDEMTDCLNNQNELPARNSQSNSSSGKSQGYHQYNGGTLCYYDENNNAICPIEKDSNGNASVNRMINNIFGYGQPITNFFQNYIISHIWGNAFDPRYFTSLWNLVLVPAWANHLLDKSSAEDGSVAKKLLDTVKAICAEYYNMSTLPWGSSPKWMAQPIDPRTQKPNDVIKGTYTIKVLRPCNGNVAGEIDLVTITI